MSTDFLYSALGCITILIVALVVAYNLLQQEDPDEDDKDILAEVTTTSDALSNLNWKDFQTEHVITSLQFPNHHAWDRRGWEDYVLNGKISLSDEVHSIVSVADDGDILLDFNPLGESNRVGHDMKSGEMWCKSKNARTVYHLLGGEPGEKCKVFKEKVRYLAAVKSVDMCPIVISDHRLASANKLVWVPLCLERIETSKLASLKKVK